ncbi:MAG TPA: hypothetical protein VD994_11710, partial [Prosthecobacter sp.]|nr:hypothetical protein [Prosthecobacter sp.]
MKNTIANGYLLSINPIGTIAARLSVLLLIFAGQAFLKADPEAPQFASSYTVRGEEFTWSYANEDGYSYHIDYYTSASGGSLTLNGPYGQSSEATISGSNSSGYTGRSIGGYLYEGGLLVNEDYQLPADSNVTMTIGGQTATFTGGSYSLTYSSDGSWTSSSTSSYSGPGGDYSSSSNSDSSGNSSGSSSTTSSQSFPPDGSTAQLFGKPLQHTGTAVSSQYYYSYDSWSAMSSESTNYTSTATFGDGTASLTRTTSTNENSSNTTYEYIISATDPAIGSFSASSTESMPAAFSRSAPSFRSNSLTLWVEGNPITWTSGMIDIHTGDVTDYYENGSFSISGNLPSWLQNQNVYAQVNYNGGGYSGSISGTPTTPVFSIGGLTILTSIQNRWALSWNIRGETFDWVSAATSGSSHTDSYVSAGGGTLTVTGEIGGTGDASISGLNSAAFTGQSISGFYYQGNLLIDDTTTVP